MGFWSFLFGGKKSKQKAASEAKRQALRDFFQDTGDARSETSGDPANRPAVSRDTQVTDHRAQIIAPSVDEEFGVNKEVTEESGLASWDAQNTADLPPDLAEVDISAATESPDQQAQARVEGRVKFWNQDRGFGFITLATVGTAAPAGTSVLARLAECPNAAPLVQGENVRFDLVRADDGRFRAAKVEYTDRIKGTVSKWLANRRFGWINSDATRGDVFVHYTQILAAGPRYLEVGEPVEFALRTDPKKGAFAERVRVFQSRFPLERFANIDRFVRGPLLEALAEMAQREEWNYRRIGQGGNKLPVLEGYILYTFARLLDEKKISFGTDRDGVKMACGNTGLVTENQEEIFAYFIENRDKRAPQKWVLTSFLKANDKKISTIGKLPDLANYFSDPADLLYNPARELRPDIDHIIKDNLHRFPENLRGNSYQLRNTVEGACEAAVRRVRRNYKAAIPQFFQDRLQLLLPLCLSDPSKADLALVVSKEGEVYIGSTALPLTMAYNNARLIARPDREWLEP